MSYVFATINVIYYESNKCSYLELLCCVTELVGATAASMSGEGQTEDSVEEEEGGGKFDHLHQVSCLLTLIGIVNHLHQVSCLLTLIGIVNHLHQVSCLLTLMALLTTCTR